MLTGFVQRHVDICFAPWTATGTWSTTSPWSTWSKLSKNCCKIYNDVSLQLLQRYRVKIKVFKTTNIRVKKTKQANVPVTKKNPVKNILRALKLKNEL